MGRLLPVIIGLAAAGALGGLVAAALVPAGGPGAASGDADLRRVSARLDEALDRLAGLESRLRVLEDAPPLAADLPVERPVAKAPPAASGAGEPPGPAVESEQFEERVKELVKESQAAQMETMGRRFATMAKQRETGILDRLSERTGLSPYQRDEMERLLERRRTAIGEFFRTMFSGEGAETVSPDQIRQKVADVQRETDEALGALLTPDQYEAFKAEDEMMRRGPFMGGPAPR